MAVDRCVICGEVIPEGMQVCPGCMEASGADEKEIKTARQLRDIANILNMETNRKSVRDAIDGILSIAEGLERRE